MRPSNSKCGVCNHEVPEDWTCLAKKEADETYTVYHMTCESSAAKLNPCEDCGYHRAVCDECREL